MRNEPRPGDVIGGKYRVRSILGRGRGILLEAEHTAFEQRVAIRVVSPQDGDDLEISKFKREARALAKLGSEHVARIIDVGTLPDGSFYLVRQYLEGLDVARYLKGKRSLSVEEAVGWIIQATEAVAETHAYGILLRELSPSHLFLADRSPGVRSGPRVLKIIDFGTSKLLRENNDSAVEEFTATTVMGLSPYSSPEMLRKMKDLDVRTDVWSLAAILYEMLSGRPPFGTDMLSLAVAITRDNAQPLSQIRRDVPPEIDEALRRALTKDKNQRTPDTHAFAASLARFAPPDARALMERIRELAASARARTHGLSDDEELEISEIEEVSDDLSEDLEEAATRVGRVADLAATQQRRPAPTARVVAPPPEERTAPRARPLVQEKTEALGVNFQPFAMGPPKPPSSPSTAPPGPVFAGAATGLSIKPPSVAPPPPPIPTAANVPKPTQVLPALMDAPSAPMMQQPVAQPRIEPAQGWATVPPARSSMSSFEPTGALPTMEAPQAANSQPLTPMPTVQAGWQQPAARGAFGRKLALMVILGAGFALVLMVVVLVVLPSSEQTAAAAASATSEPTTVTVVTLPTAVPQPASTTTTEPSAVLTTPEPDPEVTIVTPTPTTPTARTTSTTTFTAPTTTSKPTATTTTTATATNTTTAEPPKSGDPGTLVLIAVGGTCAFSVNGASKGTTNSVKVSVPAGNYSVSCKPASGAARSKSASVKAGKTVTVMFKL